MSKVERVHIRRLELEQFRGHVSMSIDVPERGLRIHGPNGSGKTTLLEAIQLLSTTRPRRGSTDVDLINHSSGQDLGLPPFARAAGVFERSDATVRVEAFIQRQERGRAARKTMKVGDRPRRATDVVGLIPTVSFAPDDLELVLGGPSSRRRFLDVLLSQIDRQYLRCLSRYAKILAQRNGLLRRGGNSVDPTPAPEQFAYWDEQLVALGAYLLAARVRMVAELRERTALHFDLLAPHIGSLDVRYESTLDATDAWWATIAANSRDTLDAAQRIGVMFERRLAESREQELLRGATMIGPHRDDISVVLASHDLDRFGSRGQQRIAVVAIKLAEIDIIVSSTSFRPIFLIDDVLSELDAARRLALIEAVAGAGSQLIVTSTDEALLDHPMLADAATLALDYVPR